MQKTLKKTMNALIILAVFLSQGCGIATPKEKVLSKLDIDLESIQTNCNNKEDIHEILGDPIIESNYWGLEVYRDSATQSVIPLFFIFPVGYYWDTIHRYTFVTYDENESLSKISTCLYNEEVFAGSLPEDNICRLESGTYTFYISVEKESDGVILYSPVSLKSYANSLKKEEMCSLFVASTSIFLSHIKIDKNDSIALWPSSILFYQVKPGEHLLKFKGELLRGSKTFNFFCKQKENIYIEATLSNTKERVHDAFFRGLTLGVYNNIGSANYVINRYEQWPAYFWEMPLMIWSDNEWILNGE